jgi:hypothetical protein
MNIQRKGVAIIIYVYIFLIVDEFLVNALMWIDKIKFTMCRIYFVVYKMKTRYRRKEKRGALTHPPVENLHEVTEFSPCPPSRNLQSSESGTQFS